MNTFSRVFVLVLASLLAGIAHAQPYPIMDMIADQVIQKYQRATCKQLWQQRSQPPSAQQQRAIQLLRQDPQMRIAFFNKVSAPILNKLFECGMIP